MGKQTHILKISDSESIEVHIQRDKRLRKTARWQREADGSLLVRIPQRYPKNSLPGLLDSISAQLIRQRQRSRRRTDADLQTRARQINQAYFNGRLSWEAIRWVKPMKTGCQPELAR